VQPPPLLKHILVTSEYVGRTGDLNVAAVDNYPEPHVVAGRAELCGRALGAAARDVPAWWGVEEVEGLEIVNVQTGAREV